MTSLLRRVIDTFGQFVFNTRFAYFEYNGSARSTADILGVVDRRIADVTQLAQGMVKSLVAGDSNVSDIRDAFAVELRRATSQMYALGRGGWTQMTAADRTAVTERLKSEYGYLQQFAKDIQSGDLSEAQIADRMNKYGNHLKSAYWEGQTVAKTDAGYTQERRILGATDKHCADCPGYADEGWVDIGELPEPGDACECGSNCLCQKEYR